MYTEFHKLLSQNGRPMKLMLTRKKLQELLCFYKCSTDLGRKFPFGELLWRGHLIQKLNKDFCLCQVGDAWVSEQKHSSFPSEVTHRLSIFYTNEEKGSHFTHLLGIVNSQQARFLASAKLSLLLFLWSCPIYCWFTLFF